MSYTRRLTRLVAPLVLLLAARAAQAEPYTLRLDPQRSLVRFDLDAFAHTIHGTLRVVRGELHFDAALGTASGEVVVDARSAETGNGSRDKTMHRRVLESARYPEIVFTAASLRGAFAPEGESDLELAGTLALHGAQHPVKLKARVKARGATLEATAPLAVPFVEWGLEDPSNLVLRVGKVVAVRLEAHGSLAPR